MEFFEMSELTDISFEYCNGHFTAFGLREADLIVKKMNKICIITLPNSIDKHAPAVQHIINQLDFVLDDESERDCFTLSKKQSK